MQVCSSIVHIQQMYRYILHGLGHLNVSSSELKSKKVGQQECWMLDLAKRWRVKASEVRDGSEEVKEGTVSSVSAGNQSQLFIWEAAVLAELLLLRTSLSSPSCLCLLIAVCVCVCLILLDWCCFIRFAVLNDSALAESRGSAQHDVPTVIEKLSTGGFLFACGSLRSS